MIGSEHSMILCHKVGVFGFQRQQQMHEMLNGVVESKNMVPEAAVQYCVQRWEEYKVALPDLQFTPWCSSYDFFVSGLWDAAGSWPWKTREYERPAEPGTQAYREKMDRIRGRIQ